MRFRGVCRMLLICIAVGLLFILITSLVGGSEYLVEIGVVALSSLCILVSLILMRSLKSFALPLIVANGGSILFIALGVIATGGISSPLTYLLLTFPALSISFGTRAVFIYVCTAIGLFFVAVYSMQMFGIIDDGHNDPARPSFQFLCVMGAFTLCALGGMSAQMSSTQARKALRRKNQQLQDLNITVQEQNITVQEQNITVQEQKGVLEAVSVQLAKYISPQLYQAIVSGEQKVTIESKRKKLTIFFSDIANFTEITDQLESEELTALLNQYLTEMSIISLEHGAYFDKFIGDAMMFYFGDPETKGVKEDASACVHMAIAMQRRLGELQVDWREKGLIDRPFETRIGINTGYCTVGNFGSEDRMDYTIIGGEVNLAARLEANAEASGILMGAETYAQVKDWLQAEEQEAITMKGFPKPIKTYKVTGIYDDTVDEGTVIRHEEDGISITIDGRRTNKKKVVQALNNALAQVEK